MAQSLVGSGSRRLAPARRHAARSAPSPCQGATSSKRRRPATGHKVLAASLTGPSTLPDSSDESSLAQSVAAAMSLPRQVRAPPALCCGRGTQVGKVFVEEACHCAGGLARGGGGRPAGLAPPRGADRGE